VEAVRTSTAKETVTSPCVECRSKDVGGSRGTMKPNEAIEHLYAIIEWIYIPDMETKLRHERILQEALAALKALDEKVEAKEDK